MRRVVVDNGPLLLHAGYLYIHSAAPYKAHLLANISFGNAETEFRAVDRFLRSMNEILFTPQVLAELTSTSKRKLKLKPYELRVFISCYRPFLSACTTKWVRKDQLLKDPDFGLGFADASVLRLAERERLPLFTTDGSVVAAGIRRRVRVETLASLMSGMPRTNN